jgi:hypothetical protein
MSDRSNAGPTADPSTATTEPQSRVSRRSVLRSAAGAGAAGLAAAAVVGTGAPALAAATSASRRQAGRAATGEAATAATAQPVVVHLRDARSGEMDVFAGTSHTRLRDPELAARLVRAAR